MRIVVRAGALALACLGAAAGPVLAQTYPTKPITMIVPYPPGGATDVIGRVLGQQLSINLGAPVVIENRTGAAGNIGAQAAAQAKPDGYTLLMGALTSHSINAVLQPGVVKYNLQKDFAPVSIVGVVPLVLVVTPSVPAQTVQGFIDLARAKPGDISFASAGNGSPQHLAGELFKLVTRTDMLHVPYKGSGPALVDLIGGQVQSMIETVPAALPQIKAGKLTALAVTSAQRSAALPDVPTIAEAGPVKGFEASSWFGLLAPAGTPPDIIDRIQQETAKALGAPALKERLLSQGAIPSGMTPAEFTRFIAAETKKWTQVVKVSGAKVD